MRYFCPPSRPVMVALVYVNMNLKANIDARTTGVWALMHNISYIHITKRRFVLSLTCYHVFLSILPY